MSLYSTTDIAPYRNSSPSLCTAGTRMHCDVLKADLKLCCPPVLPVLVVSCRTGDPQPAGDLRGKAVLPPPMLHHRQPSVQVSWVPCGHVAPLPASEVPLPVFGEWQGWSGGLGWVDLSTACPHVLVVSLHSLHHSPLHLL